MKKLIDKFLSQFIFIYNRDRIGEFLIGILVSFAGSFVVGLGFFIMMHFISGCIFGAIARTIYFSIIFIICMIINFFVCFSEDA